MLSAIPCERDFGGTAGPIAFEFDLPAEADAAAERAAEAELAPCLTAMVGRLAEPYRTAITLTSLRGVTQVDAARQVGISNSGMKSRVQRGREQLRQMLARCCAIAVDVRGGVADFHLREPGACGAPQTPSTTSKSGCRPGRAHQSEATPASIEGISIS